MEVASLSGEYKIRLGDERELAHLQALERAAGIAFREVGMDEIADDDPPSVATLQAYCRAERMWVVTSQSDVALAYIIVDMVDGCGHIEQVSVHPDHAGQGLGRALIDQVDQWAKENDLSGLTLTTFLEVPWNAPYYRRLGFVDLEVSRLTPGLRAIREQETTHGLDRWPRVAMFRAL